MNCPKCRTKMWLDREFSCGSSLSRADSRPAVNTWDGWRCYNCGTRAFSEPEIVFPYSPREDVEAPRSEVVPVAVQSVKKVMASYAFVDELYVLFAGYRKNCMSWGNMARLAGDMGHPCNENTLKKRYLLVQLQRQNDDKSKSRRAKKKEVGCCNAV